MISPDDIRFPWDRQASESEAEYYLWKLYFDQGPTRSFERLAIVSNRNIELLMGIATRLGWEKRTVAYEAYIEGVIGTLIKKQITGNQQAATRALGEVISHQVSRLSQKILLDPNSTEDTVEGILGQLKDLTLIFKSLRTIKGESEQNKARSINIMFAPTIQAGDTQGTKVIYEDVNTDE